MSQTLEPLPITTQAFTTASQANAQPASFWRDWIGIMASIGCAIHCAAMPFVISFLPALGLSFLADEAFHRWMALACFVIAMAAFVPGFRVHRRLLPGAIAVVGISLITFAAFSFAGDCCAACAVPETSSVIGAACTNACCEHCNATEREVVGLVKDPSVEKFLTRSTRVTASFVAPNFLANWAPWITPLGGMLLVSAHLLNRRYGCLCGCCETKPASKATA